MTTPRLLWGMTWRGTIWGLLAGTVLGIIYGAIFVEILLLVAYDKQGLYVQTPNQISGGIAAMLFIALIGAIAGGIFGAPTGLGVGWLDGLLVGILTRMFFLPLRNTRVYRWTIAIISAIFTAITAWACFIGILILYEPTRASVSVPLILIVAVPAPIAGIAAGFISRLITRWYERESTKVTTQNVSSN